MVETILQHIEDSNNLAATILTTWKQIWNALRRAFVLALGYSWMDFLLIHLAFRLGRNQGPLRQRKS